MFLAPVILINGKGSHYPKESRRFFSKHTPLGRFITKLTNIESFGAVMTLDTFLYRATVLYDKPAASFRRTEPEDRHSLFSRLAQEFPELSVPCSNPQALEDQDVGTVFTEGASSSRAGSLKVNRPALLVSSTSWTGSRPPPLFVCFAFHRGVPSC